MNKSEAESFAIPRRVRIARPAFQDMHYLVAPRLTARAQIRRHAMKLGYWSSGDSHAGDVDCVRIPNTNLYSLMVSDGFGLAEGFRVVFCEESCPEPEGTICILSVMRDEEEFSPAAIEILCAREVVARERLRGWIA